MHDPNEIDIENYRSNSLLDILYYVGVLAMFKQFKSIQKMRSVSEIALAMQSTVMLHDILNNAQSMASLFKMKK